MLKTFACWTGKRYSLAKLKVPWTELETVCGTRDVQICLEFHMSQGWEGRKEVNCIRSTKTILLHKLLQISCFTCSLLLLRLRRPGIYCMMKIPTGLRVWTHTSSLPRQTTIAKALPALKHADLVAHAGLLQLNTTAPTAFGTTW